MRTFRAGQIPFFFAIFSFLILFPSCQSDDDAEEACFDHFNYDDTTSMGPADWADYCVAEGTENACGSFIRQSPIDIVGATVDPALQSLTTLYENSPVDIINNGHTVQFNYLAATSLTFQEKSYGLSQFHFHANSEHTVDGSPRPLEVHLVHQHPDGTLAVIGVFFEIGAENAFLSTVINDLPTEEGEQFIETTPSYTAASLLPANRSYYTYEGSLTTPPCSEVVEWIVMQNAIEISQEQLNVFVAILNNNSRPVQPLGGRTIGLFSE